jgi:DNA-binding MarR family transcriptional regulator
MATANRVNLSDAITRVILHVFRLNGRLLAAGDRLVKDLGLTSARWQVLGAISFAQTAQSVANIARSMGLTRQAVQRTVNDLVASGLLEFAPNPHHQRAQLVMLTKKGVAAYDAAMARQLPWANTWGAGLRDKDLATAEQVLSMLTERLETAEPTPVRNARNGGRLRMHAQARRRSYGQAR